MILVLLTLLVVHVAASDAVFLVVRRFLRGRERPSSLRIFLYTRGLGPAALAVVAYTLLVFLPGRGAATYLTLIAVLFLVPAGRAFRELPVLRRCYGEAWRWLGHRVRRPSLMLVATALLLAAAALVSVALPLVEHDGLAAAIEARIALRDASFANYLAIEEPDPESGYYMETFRPPFLQSLYVFYGWLAGAENLDLLIRTTSPVFGLHCLVLLTVVVRRHHSGRAAAWSAFLLAVTPIFFYMTYNNGIDTSRLYLALLALFWMVELSATGSGRIAVVAGTVTGFAVFCHVLSLPLLAGGGLAFVLFGEARLPKKVLAAGLLVVVALVTGASFHYLLSPRVAEKIDQTFGSEGLYELAQLLPGREQPSSLPGPESGPGAEPEPGSPPEPPQAPPPAPAEPPGTGAPRPDEVTTAPTPEPETPPGAASPSDSEPQPGTEATGPQATEPTRRPGRKRLPELATDRHARLLEMRGHGRTPLQQLLFGRLQMFTGIEHFGWIFYVFWIGAGIWLVRGGRNHLERVLFTSALVTAFVVLSGIRQLSWSNPRYIASLLPVAAYFGGPLLAAAERRFLHTRGRRMLLVSLLVFPVLLVTAIRGAKVEITNPGDFYSDFRSLRWVEHGLEHPRDALATFWNEYLGIRKTLRYFFSDRDEQLRHAHDYLAAVLWIRDNLPEDVRVLVFRDARFFYYSQRQGVVWYSPVIHQRGYRFMPSPQVLQRYLRGLGITHVLVDDYSTRLPGYVDRWAPEMLADPALAAEVFEFGTARVYRLTGPPVPPIDPPLPKRRKKRAAQLPEPRVP